MDPQPSNKVSFLKNLYLYLVSFVALMMVVFSTANVIDIVLRTYVFTKADEIGYYGPVACPVAPVRTDKPTFAVPSTEDCLKQQADYKKQQLDNQTAQRQRDLVRDLSLIIVGVPLFAYHWKLARKKENA